MLHNSMITNIKMSFYISLVCFFCCALSACGKADGKKKWDYFSDIRQEKVNGSEAPSDEDVKVFLKENISSFESVVKFCEENSAVRWVDEKDIFYFDGGLKGKNFDSDLPMVQDIIKRRKIHSVACGRRGDVKDHPLSNVDFTMYASGIGVSGASKGIFYNTKWAFQNDKYNSVDKLAELGFKYTGIEGWFIYDDK